MSTGLQKNKAIPEGADPPALPKKAVLPSRAYRKNWWLGLLAFAVIAGLGLPIAWVKGTAVYFDQGVMHINFKFASNLRADKEIDIQSINQYNRFVDHQIRTVGRYDIVEQALDELGDSPGGLWRRESETKDQSIRRLMGSLSINAVLNTYLLTVGMDHRKPEVIPLIINKVMTIYMNRQKQELFFGIDDRLKSLREQRQKLIGDAVQREKRIAELGVLLGITSFEKGKPNAYDGILADMNATLATAWQTRMQAQAALDTLRGRQTAIRAISLNSQAATMVTNDRSLGDLRTALYKRRSELVQKISGLKKGHMTRVIVERELAGIKAEVTKATKEATAQITRSLVDKRDADLAIELAEANAELEKAAQVEAALRTEIGRRKADLSTFIDGYAEANTLRAEVEIHQRSIGVLTDRISELELESSAPGYVRLVTWASKPEFPVKGGRKKIFIIFLVLASVVGSILPLVLDFFNPHLRVGKDVHRVLGFSPNAVMPDSGKATYRGLITAQIRRMALSISREHDLCPQKGIYSVTSAVKGEGKTMIALSLADELRRLGLKVIVVNCDPDNNLEESKQADIVLSREGKDVDLEAELKQYILTGNRRQADRLPQILAKEEGRSVEIEALRSVLQSLSKTYEIVLIDSPALLVSANSETLAYLSHGVLMVIAADSTQSNEVKRAASIIERVSPEIVGAVLNRVSYEKELQRIRASVGSQASMHEEEQASISPAWYMELDDKLEASI